MSQQKFVPNCFQRINEIIQRGHKKKVRLFSLVESESHNPFYQVMSQNKAEKLHLQNKCVTGISNLIFLLSTPFFEVPPSKTIPK